MLATTPQISIEWFVQSCHCNEQYIQLSLHIIYVAVYDRNVCHHLGKDDHMQASVSSHRRCPSPPIYTTPLSSRSCLHILNHPNFLSLELGIWRLRKCWETWQKHHTRPGSTRPHDDRETAGSTNCKESQSQYRDGVWQQSVVPQGQWGRRSFKLRSVFPCLHGPTDSLLGHSVVYYLIGKCT